MLRSITLPSTAKLSRCSDQSSLPSYLYNMNITSPDDLLRLAPDAKSLEAGRRLFYSRRWRLVGGDGDWLWGEFVYGNDTRNGKPGKAIESAVELLTGRFVCSCRAHQRPCAHGLALVLMLKNDQARITVGQPPSWVRSVQFRAERREKVVAVKDTLAADNRQAARLDLMTAGVEELEIRLLDVARRGIADTLAQGPGLLQSAAARLTDAKLPGPAGHLRRLAGLGPDGTEADFARTLGDLYLFVRAWKNRRELTNDRHDELLRFAGMATRKEDLLSRPARTDHWLVMGVRAGQDDKLRWRRTWLRGETSRRYALLQDYAFGERPFERSWPLGASFRGDVHYYPGSYPQRAVFARPVAGGRPYDGLKGYVAYRDLRTNYQQALAVNPWLYAYPVYLQRVRPLVHNRQQLLLDASGESLPLHPDYENFYRLLAISGGAPISLFAEFDGYRALPLSVVTGMGLVEG